MSDFKLVLSILSTGTVEIGERGKRYHQNQHGRQDKPYRAPRHLGLYMRRKLAFGDDSTLLTLQRPEGRSD